MAFWEEVQLKHFLKHEGHTGCTFSRISAILGLAAFYLVLACVIGVVSGASSKHSVPAVPPTISGAVIGPRQVVFDARNGCEEIDSSDAPARAFRDYRGFVHLFATHYVARAMIGSNLNDVKHDCRVVYRSPQDSDPSDFQYKNWLFSFYSTDGLKVAALVHSEYDAIEIPGMCATPEDSTNCWWNTVTFARSTDGGYTFTVPKAPQNLVAALPYRYVFGNRAGAYGYNGPSNILKIDGMFYALINDWPYKLQKYGPCLIRTSDAFDPGSWRAWNGADFTMRFADPYRVAIESPEDHVCTPVYAGSAESLVQEMKTGWFITTQSAPDGRFDGPPGFYIQASIDLIHWSKPSILVTFKDLQIADGPGKWIYEYESLLDPASTDWNFSTVTDTPFLYFVRSDGNHPPYATVLFRLPIKLRIGNS